MIVFDNNSNINNLKLFGRRHMYTNQTYKYTIKHYVLTEMKASLHGKQKKKTRNLLVRAHVSNDNFRAKVATNVYFEQKQKGQQYHLYW